MIELKKYTRFYFILAFILSVTFSFMFTQLSIIKDVNGHLEKEIFNHLNINNENGGLEKKIYNIYLLNFILLISVISIFITISFMIRKMKANSLQLAKDATETSEKKQNIEDFMEFENKAIMEMLNTLENSISVEKTNEKKLEVFLKHLVKNTESVQAAFFLTIEKDNKKNLRFVSGYAFYVPEDHPIEFHFGEGLSGQVAIDQKLLNLSGAKVERLPVYSGMGSSVPQHLIICPILNESETVGILELASFRKYERRDEVFIEKAALLMSQFLEKSIIDKQSLEAKNE